MNIGIKTSLPGSKEFICGLVLMLEDKQLFQ